MTKSVFQPWSNREEGTTRQEGEGLKRERMRSSILLTPFPVLQVAMALMQAGADVDVANCVSKPGERG